MTLNVDDRAAGDDNGLAHSRRLAELAATGNHDAWELIYREVYPRLRAYAVHHVGHQAAEDLVSETMTRAIRGIDGFRWTAAGIEPWLFGIARRVAADFTDEPDATVGGPVPSPCRSRPRRPMTWSSPTNTRPYVPPSLASVRATANFSSCG